MSLTKSLHRLALVAMLAGGWASGAPAQTLLNEVNTVGTSATGLPIQQNFDISATGSYALTFTDLGATLPAPLSPAPLATTPPVAIAVTQGSTLIGSVTGTTNGVATLNFNAATTGTYTVRITGAPGANPGSGPVGVQVVSSATNTAIFSYAGALAPPQAATSSLESVINTAIGNGTTTPLPSSGTYTVSLTDFATPTALGALTLAIVEPSCTPTPLCATLPAPGGALTTSVALDSTKTYRVFAVGQATSGAGGGLYSAVIQAPGGAVAFSETLPVGAVQQIGSATLAAGPQTLVLSDLKFPAALSQLAASLITNNQVAASASAAGTQTFTAVAGSYQIFAQATPGTGGTGSYELDIGPQGSAPVFSTVQPASSGVATTAVFVQPGTVTTAGSYQLQLADLGFPANLVSAQAALVQGGQVIGTPLSSPGTSTGTLSVGSAYAVTVATSAAAGGLVGVQVVPAAGGSPLLVGTEGVGAAFNATSVAINTTGSYTVNVQDLGFPAKFQNLDVVVTQGTQSIGSIYGGGSFKFNASTAGNYAINFIAQPDATALAGTYGISIAPTPPAPTVTFTSSEPQVASGGTVTLTWSSTNATSCTASGGWSGSLATSGSQASPAVTASTTFTLGCTGAGGTTNESVTVALAPAPGGGGALDLALLLALGSVLALVILSRRLDELRRPDRR